MREFCRSAGMGGTVASWWFIFDGQWDADGRGTTLTIYLDRRTVLCHLEQRQLLSVVTGGSSLLWSTNVYGRYHHLRDVAR